MTVVDCERIRNGWLVQPSNALSSVAYLVGAAARSSDGLVAAVTVEPSPPRTAGPSPPTVWAASRTTDPAARSVRGCTTPR